MKNTNDEFKRMNDNLPKWIEWTKTKQHYKIIGKPVECISNNKNVVWFFSKGLIQDLYEIRDEKGFKE